MNPRGGRRRSRLFLVVVVDLFFFFIVIFVFFIFVFVSFVARRSGPRRVAIEALVVGGYVLLFRVVIVVVHHVGLDLVDDRRELTHVQGGSSGGGGRDGAVFPRGSRAGRGLGWTLGPARGRRAVLPVVGHVLLHRLVHPRVHLREQARLRLSGTGFREAGSSWSAPCAFEKPALLARDEEHGALGGGFGAYLGESVLAEKVQHPLELRGPRGGGG